MERDFKFWKTQIMSAKSEHKTYLDTAKLLNKKYTDKSVRINLFYSNIQTLKSALLNNYPRAEVMRRFFNSLESDKAKSELYATSSRVIQSAVDYYSSNNDIVGIVKKGVEEECKTGRAVIWIEYIPEIVQVERDLSMFQRLGSAIGIVDKFEEKIGGQDIRVIALRPEEYLESYGLSEEEKWWKARRHLMTADKIKDRFGYDASQDELTFATDTKKTAQKMGEVWEIWDKSHKKRIFILLTSLKTELLEDIEDPYKLNDFYPCWTDSFLTNSETGMPVPEYEIYEQLHDQLNGLADKNKQLQKAVKYIQILATKNSAKVQEINAAEDGAIISLDEFDPDTRNLIATLDLTAVNAMIENNTRRIQEIKAECWELTGISDIMRGSSDPRETAEAQRIKGLYGGLRFKDRQDNVQNGIKHIFRIIAELICEHWDWNILAEVSCVELLSDLQKQTMAFAIKQGQQMPDEVMNRPTSDEVITLLRDDKMRNFVITIESSATVFDDLADQNANIQQLVEVVTQALQAAASPEDMNIVITLAKMKMASIKISTSISNALIDNLQAKAVQMKAAAQNPQPPQASPDTQLRVTAENQRHQIDIQMQQEKNQHEHEIEILKRNQQHEIDMAKIQLESDKVMLKNKEIDAEILANQFFIRNKMKPDTNLG